MNKFSEIKFSVGCLVWLWLRSWLCQDICQILMRYYGKKIGRFFSKNLWPSPNIWTLYYLRVVGEKWMNKIFVSINYLVSYLGHPPPIYRHNGRSCQIYFRTQGVWLFSQTTIMQSSVHSSKVEKIVKGSLDWIPSPSPSVKIMGGKVYLRCKGKTFLGDVNKLFGFKSLLTTPSNVLPYYFK